VSGAIFIQRLFRVFQVFVVFVALAARYEARYPVVAMGRGARAVTMLVLFERVQVSKSVEYDGA
jgi:hypothetical protein